MESGFTYNNVHCETMKCYYVPNAEDRWFNDGEFNVYDTDVAWKHGGYYYGNRLKKRTFTLKCYFEEITTAEREDIRQWQHRNTSGQLIFDDKPFVYWNVRPTKVVPGQIYNDLGKYSGSFTVTFTAYEPFGYLTRKSNAGTENDHAEDYCNIIATADMPDAPTTGDTVFSVYNPGTEVCGLTLILSGTTSHPIMFQNYENKTRCIIRDLPSNNLKLDINGDTGYVDVYITKSSTIHEPGFAYHDRGIVRLSPGMNTILIYEQNSSGNWDRGTGMTLSLSSIAIDYNPRIL